jgi:putative inorganic carbon (hco3(-)) transporter
LLSRDLVASAGVLKGWFLAPMVFGLIVSSKIKDKETAEKNLLAFFLSTSLVAMVAFVYFIFNRVTFDGRLSAFLLSPNYLAMYLAPGFLVGLWLLGRYFKSGRRAIIVIMLIFLAVALYLTYSFLAWLAVLLAVFLWLFIEFKRQIFNKRTFIIGCYFLAIFIVVLSFSQLHGEKLNNLLHSPRSSLQSRLMIWRAALEIGKDHPVLGIGPAMFQSYYLEYQKYFPVQYLEWAVPHPHNIFLAFWLETGLIGLAGFIWLLIVFFS